ncbi:tyrosine-type recombinase/integrase [Microbulbifer sp. ZKSA002]|uniref:tyrosine-type recombinase/integrase n=1 Tax=Microbulbifer sp. ZKSA002 TaxID=3243388 RepID=UPI0040393D98
MVELGRGIKRENLKSGQVVYKLNKTHKGERIKATCDSEQECREVYLKRVSDIDSGKDLGKVKEAEKQREKLTMRDLFKRAEQHPKVWKHNSTNVSRNNTERSLEMMGWWDKSPFELTAEDYLDFIAECEKQGNSQNTINHKLAYLNGLFKAGVLLRFFSETEVVFPVTMQGTVNEDASKTRFAWDDETVARFENVMKHVSLDWQALFLGLLHTGMRPAEMNSLKISSIDTKSWRVTFLRKKKRGKKVETQLPVVSQLKPVWEAYIKERLEEGATLNDSFITGLRHERSRADAFNTIKKMMGVSDESVTYTLRHTCCTRLIKRGVNLVTVMNWMGHSTIQTTMNYVHFSPEMFDEVDAKVSGNKILNGNLEGREVVPEAGLEPAWP